MTTPQTAEIADVQDRLLLPPGRHGQIVAIRDRTTDPDTRQALTDLLDHVDGVEWTILGDDPAGRRKVARHSDVLRSIAEVYRRRIRHARDDGREAPGHEHRSLSALVWAAQTAERMSSIDLSRPPAELLEARGDLNTRP